MPRLFTGLEIPSDVAADLAMLRGGVAGARWIDVENYHITLRFIGDVDDRTANEAAAILDEIQRPSFTVTLDGLSWFGADKPRAIVAKVKANPALMDLQAEQERRLRRIGLEPETRKFLPHVTLARLRGAGARAVADYLALRGARIAEPFMADRFVLYSARDGSGGGPYVVEAAYPLG